MQTFLAGTPAMLLTRVSQSFVRRMHELKPNPGEFRRCNGVARIASTAGGLSLFPICAVEVPTGKPDGIEIDGYAIRTPILRQSLEDVLFVDHRMFTPDGTMHPVSPLVSEYTITVGHNGNRDPVWIQVFNEDGKRASVDLEPPSPNEAEQWMRKARDPFGILGRALGYVVVGTEVLGVRTEYGE